MLDVRRFTWHPLLKVYVMVDLRIRLRIYLKSRLESIFKDLLCRTVSSNLSYAGMYIELVTVSGYVLLIR